MKTLQDLLQKLPGGGAGILVRIRPAMRSSLDLDWLSVAPGKGHTGCRVGWNYDHDLDLPRLDRPRRFGQTVGHHVSCASVGEITARTWSDFEVAIARSGRCKPANRAMQPVGDGSESVVVERGHLSRVDRTIRALAIPAFPNGGSSHHHRIEPGRAFMLGEQAEGEVNRPDAAQGVADQRCSDEAGADVVPAFAHECS